MLAFRAQARFLRRKRQGLERENRYIEPVRPTRRLYIAAVVKECSTDDL